MTLPLVVLVSFMAQPRLLFAMAKDGLLPKLFAEVDSRGTLLKGSLVRRRPSASGFSQMIGFVGFFCPARAVLTGRRKRVRKTLN